MTLSSRDLECVPIERVAQSAAVLEHAFNHSTSSHPDSHCAQRRRENVILRGPFGQKDLDKAGMKMVEGSRAWHDWAEFQAPPLQLARTG